jgi:hypothetical protein
MKRIIFLSIFFLFLSFLVQPPSYAQSKQTILRISPIVIYVSLQPNKQYTYEVTAENLSELPLIIHLSKDNFFSVNDLDNSKKINPLSKWLSFNLNDYTLNPHQKKGFTVNVSLPRSIPIGGYYTTLYLEPHIYSSDASVVMGKIGIPILANIGVQDSIPPQISDFSFNRFFVASDPLVTTIDIKNPSLFHKTIKPIIHASGLFNFQKTIVLDDKTIFPGATREWKNTLNISNYPYGIYKMELFLLEGNKKILKSHIIVKLPVKELGTGVFILFLLIILIKMRKQLKEALHVFFSSKS